MLYVFYIIIYILCFFLIEIVIPFALLPFLKFMSAPDNFALALMFFFFALAMLLFFCKCQDHFQLEINKFFKKKLIFSSLMCHQSRPIFMYIIYCSVPTLGSHLLSRNCIGLHLEIMANKFPSKHITYNLNLNANLLKIVCS